MNMFRLMSVLVLISTLAGCQLYQVKGEVAGVEVEAKTDEGAGEHCPPGQAKKGRC